MLGVVSDSVDDRPPIGQGALKRWLTVLKGARGLSTIPNSSASHARGALATVASLGVLGGFLIAVGSSSLSASPAQAFAGSLKAPAVIYQEDFENRSANSNTLLDQYHGQAGQTYSGDSYWVDRPNCNGFIINYTSPQQASDCSGWGGDPTGVGMYDLLTTLPFALGLLNGSPAPATNAAVSAFTNTTGLDDAIEFQTKVPLNLPTATGRFLTFSVDAAEVVENSCNLPNHARLMFYLRDAAGMDHQLTSKPIENCTDPRAKTFTVTSPHDQIRTIKAGTYAADQSILLTGSSFGIVLRNQDGQWAGNDAAFDNVKVLDVTPSLEKAFSPASVPLGGTSTLTFTVANTSELGSKSGWSFTDSLPAGLVVASSPNVGGTCRANVTAPARASSIRLANGVLGQGQGSCTVTVDVTSSAFSPSTSGPVIYTNGAANMTSLVGLNPPVEPASVEVHPAPALSIRKAVSPTSVTRAGDRVTYSFLVTNTGTTNLSDVSVNDAAFTGTGTAPVVSCPAPAALLAPGAHLTCTATYSVTQADVDAGIVTNTATAQGTPPGTVIPVLAMPSTANVTAAAAPGLSVVKSATPSAPASFRAGQVITYSFLVTNTGNVTVSNVSVDDIGFTGSGTISPVSCPARVASLAPGAHATCTASYTITPADVKAGKIGNDATAKGAAQGSKTPVVAPKSHVDVPALQAAAAHGAPSGAKSVLAGTMAPGAMHPSGATVETGGSATTVQARPIGLLWAMSGGALLLLGAGACLGLRRRNVS